MNDEPEKPSWRDVALLVVFQMGLSLLLGILYEVVQYLMNSNVSGMWITAVATVIGAQIYGYRQVKKRKRPLPLAFVRRLAAYSVIAQSVISILVFIGLLALVSYEDGDMLREIEMNEFLGAIMTGVFLMIAGLMYLATVWAIGDGAKKALKTLPVLIAICLSFFCAPIDSSAREETCRLSYAEMYIASDPGHGGSFITRIIERRGPNAVSRMERVEETRFPVPGHEKGFKMAKKTTPIAKDDSEVESFFIDLEKLKIMSWKDRKTDAVFLHPTSYDFTFRDSCGRENKFEYWIEGSRRFDKKYDSLVEKFEGLFILK